jgi:hypothetical protein
LRKRIIDVLTNHCELQIWRPMRVMSARNKAQSERKLPSSPSRTA